MTQTTTANSEASKAKVLPLRPKRRERFYSMANGDDSKWVAPGDIPELIEEPIYATGSDRVNMRRLDAREQYYGAHPIGTLAGQRYDALITETRIERSQESAVDEIAEQYAINQ